MHRKYLHLSMIAVFSFLLSGNFAHAQNKGKSEANNNKSATKTNGEFGNVDGVTAEQLKNYLTYIASDEMGGRNTPSKELDLTAKFIALNLSRWGFKPAGSDGTFLQKIELKSMQLNAEKTTASFGTKQLKFGEDFVGQNTPGKASGSLVFVSYGMKVKAKNIDPYKDLDVKDKIMIVTGGFPKGIDNSDFSGKVGEDFDYPTHYAETHGAKGIIYVPSKSFIDNWKSRVTSILTQIQWTPEFSKKSATQVPRILMSEALAEQIFKGEKLDYKAVTEAMQAGKLAESFAFNTDKSMSFEVATTDKPATTNNVVGILEGSDPVLKNEYVAIGAHYDHVGTECAPIGNDNICNGADDDGSGTTAVLAIAEAMSQGPRPKRSILFVWHAGEERGLWGSEYIVDNLPVPLTSIIAQFNIDMIGRSKKDGDTNPKNADLSGPDEIYVIGSKLMSTGLGELSESVNNSYLKMKFNYRYDDPNDKERFFYRSDHYNYAKKGIPIVFYFSGVHEDYHQASDHVDKIDFQKMEKVTRTAMATLWKSANLPKRFVVDKPLPKQLQE